MKEKKRKITSAEAVAQTTELLQDVGYKIAQNMTPPSKDVNDHDVAIYTVAAALVYVGETILHARSR